MSLDFYPWILVFIRLLFSLVVRQHLRNIDHYFPSSLRNSLIQQRILQTSLYLPNSSLLLYDYSDSNLDSSQYFVLGLEFRFESILFTQFSKTLLMENSVIIFGKLIIKSMNLTNFDPTNGLVIQSPNISLVGQYITWILSLPVKFVT